MGTLLLVAALGTTGADVCHQSGPTTATQLVDGFDWPIQELPPDPPYQGFRYYGYLASDRGEMGAGEPRHGVSIENGEARLFAETDSTGTSWTGLWYSLSGLAGERRRTLDPRRALPPPIGDAFQVRILAWRAKVRGTGSLKIEVCCSGPILCQSWVYPVNSVDYVTLSAPFPTCGRAKLLNVVADSPADLIIDEVSLETRVPALTPLRYAFLMSYAQLLRGYDPASGRVRDHNQWPIGDFDSVPAMGFVALASAAAAHLGVVPRADATAVAARAIEALLRVPRCKGWLPHWLRGSERHPDSEWSTVDSALALLSAIEAANILEMPNQLRDLQALVDGLDFDAVTSSDGRISHGLSAQGTQCPVMIPQFWDAWGGETAMVELLRGYRDSSWPTLTATRTPPAYCGRGFITELAGLFFSQLGAADRGPDRYGVDWHEERQRHHARQREFAAGQLLFGESPVEVRSSIGETIYLEAGIGTSSCPPRAGLPGFGDAWRAPHYGAMASSLQLAPACAVVDRMRAEGLMPPLGGPAEAVLVDQNGDVLGWHPVQTSLNAFFNTLGYYHAVVRQEGRRDVVYRTVCGRDPRLGQAAGVIVNRCDPDCPNCTP